MVNMPTAAEIDRAYTDSIGRVPAKYKEKVEKVTNWQEKAIEGQGLFVEKMSDSSVLARREAKLRDVTNEDWKRRAADLGSKRIADGMRANAPKRMKNYEKSRLILEGVTLPPRSSSWEANIDNRVKPIAKALVEGKESI